MVWGVVVRVSFVGELFLHNFYASESFTFAIIIIIIIIMARETIIILLIIIIIYRNALTTRASLKTLLPLVPRVMKRSW